MMKYTFVRVLWVLLAMVTISSCHISRKKRDKHGNVIVVSKSKSSSKDNGLHKGWYKNPNNPHHPRTTNPGHTKNQGGGKNTTVVVVKGSKVTSSNQKGKGGQGGGNHSKGKKGKN